jgi:MoxR-like ATPase
VSRPRILIDALRETVALDEDTLALVVACALAGGHLLLEDVPGVGKTLLGKSLAALLGLGFRRVQFTPDMLPSDLSGVSLYSAQTGEFRFAPGPLFTHVLLADEINRASPRTQAGLLEAMEERQVSLDGTTYPLPKPFFVIATQNPTTFEGTYPLPEVQLDRFMAVLSLGYPVYDHEMALLEGRHGVQPERSPITEATLANWQTRCRDIHVEGSLRTYLLNVVRASRVWPGVSLGISPRGALAWQALARGMAFLHDRDHVIPEDLRRTAGVALAHRIVLTEPASTMTKRNILQGIIEREPVPR